MDTTALLRMMPPVTEANRPFWDGAEAGELRLPHGPSGRPWFPEAPVDPVTLSPEITWRAVSGRGRLWSWTVLHQRYFEAFADELPYLVAMIELAEGPWLVSALVDPPDDLRCDDPVEVTFRTVTGGDERRTIPMFRVARS